jgi:Uri superfamily endonuclease
MTKNILKGTYCLIIQLRDDNVIEIGKKGPIKFNKGYYVYVGSALNSLETRLKRHLSNKKKLFWHVDYLLNCSSADIKEIVFAVNNGKWECIIASKISSNGVEIKGFGSSDCKCESHLFRFDEIEISIKTCCDAFKTLELEPKMLDDL